MLMHSVLWRWRGLIVTGHLGVAKCLIRGGLCVRMPVAGALTLHLLLSHVCWQLPQGSFLFSINTQILSCCKVVIAVGRLFYGTCTEYTEYAMFVWWMEPKGFEKVMTYIKCYICDWDQKPAAPYWLLVLNLSASPSGLFPLTLCTVC